MADTAVNAEMVPQHLPVAGLSTLMSAKVQVEEKVNKKRKKEKEKKSCNNRRVLTGSAGLFDPCIVDEGAFECSCRHLEIFLRCKRGAFETFKCDHVE